MNGALEQAARRGGLFAVRIEAAMASTCPQRWADAEAAAARIGADWRQRLTSPEPMQRALAVVELLWFGAARRELFERLFGLQFAAVWADWGCDAANANVSN